jgi:hypothetical protein
MIGVKLSYETNEHCETVETGTKLKTKKFELNIYCDAVPEG